MHNLLNDFGVCFILDPANEVPSTIIQGSWLRTTNDDSLVIVTDGSQVNQTIGFSAVVLDSDGILGSFSGHTVVFDASSWVAEWFGKLLGVCMVKSLGKFRVFLAADNIICCNQWTNFEKYGLAYYRPMH